MAQLHRLQFSIRFEGNFQAAGNTRIMRHSYRHSLALTYSGRERLNHVSRQLFRIPNRTTLYRRFQPRRKGIASRREETIDESQTVQKRYSIHCITRWASLTGPP